ncbi:MAG: hypothetical protein IJ239_01080, partial [Eubacterium sp.]|nr:hypothetical protein [Eubacterium sp.]
IDEAVNIISRFFSAIHRNRFDLLHMALLLSCYLRPCGSKNPAQARSRCLILAAVLSFTSFSKYRRVSSTCAWIAYFRRTCSGYLRLS